MKTGEREKIFKALGDSNRLSVMDLLKGRELSAGQILKEIKMGQSTLSHHMKILCDSGLVNSRKDSRWVFYSINEELVAEVKKSFDGWAE